MKRYIPIFASLSFLFALAYVLAVRPVHGKSSPVAPPPESHSGHVVAAAGLVEPELENIELSTPIAGLVTQLYVRPGDVVRKGQPLFALDDRELSADLAVKKAMLAAAQARLNKLERAPRAEDVPPAQAKVEEAAALLADANVQVELIDSVTDKRAVRDEDVRRRHLNLDAARARLKEAQANLALIKAGTWSADLEVAQAELNQAAAGVRQDEINLERLTICAPLDGVVLQSKVRLGQYAQVGPLTQPLMLFGAGRSLHVRASVDENDAWRVQAGAAAVGQLRGNSRISFPLSFVRIEPYVIPKRSLTGDVTERVDTRVMEVIYEFKDPQPRVFDGQQLDIFIDSAMGSDNGTNAGNNSDNGTTAGDKS